MTNEDLNTEASHRTPRRSRKRIDTSPNVVSRSQSIEEHQYEAALRSSDAKTALFQYEHARTVRDSVSRKLCGGSTAVTVNDLALCETALSSAKSVLAQVARDKPILNRHLVFASVAEAANHDMN